MRNLVIFALCLLIGGALGYGVRAPEDKIIPHTLVSDTILSGMHYTIYTEPRTGDLVVVNSTIDSLKVLMFKSQIK